MADGKKSFLLYCDIQSTINKLSDVRAGILFKTILAYVNDQNPIIEDELLDLVFEPIKVALKRDLVKYENIVNRNHTNGLLGGRPKKEEPKEPNGLIDNPKKPKKPKKADSVIDSDIDIGIDIVNDIKEKEVHTPTPFEKFNTWLKKTYPNVSRMKTQMKEDEMNYLIETYTKEKFFDILSQMENKADLTKKYVSVYLTARNWLKK